MAKKIRHAFRADLKIDEVAIPTSGRGGISRTTMTGIVSGVACSWALLVLGAAAAGAEEATTPPASEQPGAEQAAEPASPLIGPPITGPFVIPQPSPKYALGPLGDIYVDGIGAGIVQWQNNPFPGNRVWQADLSNGQLFVQKPDGLIQFYAQPGAYSIWVLGSRNVSTAQATFGTNSPDGTLFGWFPLGYLKIAPSDNFSFQGGQADNSDRRRVPLFVSEHKS
jgi:hypothetical protein